METMSPVNTIKDLAPPLVRYRNIKLPCNDFQAMAPLSQVTKISLKQQRSPCKCPKILVVDDNSFNIFAIVSLLNDKEKRDKIGAAGRKRVEELFTIETNVKHTMDMYMKVLGI